MKNFKNYRQLVGVLRKHLPLPYPVQIRRVKMKGYDGICAKNEEQFFIKIDAKLSEKMAIETLLHEYAHALAWNHRHDKWDDAELLRKQHDATWGVAYSEVYHVYEVYYLEDVNVVIPLGVAAKKKK
jgi:hypothetical protein